MRLGILVFDNENGGSGQFAVQAADTVAEALRARDIDVVINAPEPDALTTPERPAVSDAEATTPIVVATFAQAQEAGPRLGRADCDGVLFWLGEGANPAFAAPAALTLSCPILLCANPNNPAWYDTAGVLADRGIPFERLLMPESNATQNAAVFVEAWLIRNNKKERQKGTEAAQKLFGKRLIVSGNTQTAVDAAQWFHQFGVLVTSADVIGEAEENDLVVQNGDGCAELTFFLLRGVCYDDPQTLRLGVASEPVTEPVTEPTTLVQITRRKGRFTCLLALSPPAAIQSENFAHALFGSIVHSASGDVRVRMRAACSVLDIDVVEWP